MRIWMGKFRSGINIPGPQHWILANYYKFTAEKLTAEGPKRNAHVYCTHHALSSEEEVSQIKQAGPGHVDPQLKGRGGGGATIQPSCPSSMH
jgi:hypothetical protein